MMDLHCQLLSPDETPLLVSLVRQCYGTDYAHAYFYDAVALRELIEQGLLHCAVAMRVAAAGRREVVAHMAVKIESRGDRIADNFAGMMLPEYRGQGVLLQLGSVLLPVYAALGLRGLQTATVTHHAFSQKISSNTGTVTTGCLLADSPGSNADGLQIAHRMPILLQFYCLQSLPRCEWYAPLVYRQVLEKICVALQWPVVFREGDETPAVRSEVETQHNARRSTMLLRFRCIGQDADVLLAQFQRNGENLAAGYVDVPLTDPAAPVLVAAANTRGWFFGGVIAGCAGTDFLRLQRCALPPPSSRDGIIDSSSRELVAAILQDRERVTHRSLA